jgi:oligoendopeptidase F
MTLALLLALASLSAFAAPSALVSATSAERMSTEQCLGWMLKAVSAASEADYNRASTLGGRDGARLQEVRAVRTELEQKLRDLEAGKPPWSRIIDQVLEEADGQRYASETARKQLLMRGARQIQELVEKQTYPYSTAVEKAEELIRKLGQEQAEAKKALAQAEKDRASLTSKIPYLAKKRDQLIQLKKQQIARLELEQERLQGDREMAMSKPSRTPSSLYGSKGPSSGEAFPPPTSTS